MRVLAVDWSSYEVFDVVPMWVEEVLVVAGLVVIEVVAVVEAAVAGAAVDAIVDAFV